MSEGTLRDQRHLLQMDGEQGGVYESNHWSQDLDTYAFHGRKF